MIANLFSSFDPVSSFMGLPLNWVSVLLGVFFLPLAFWACPSRWMRFWALISRALHREFYVLSGGSCLRGTLVFFSLFVFIFFNSFIGLIPYVFTATSHLVMTFRLSLPLWTGFILYGWYNHTSSMLSHIVPMGTPILLIPLIVVIETISNVIRPGTLAVRLSANMIAGHLLLTLIRSSCCSLPGVVALLLVLLQILLVLLEIAVAGIQSFVFAALRVLYSSETS